MEKTVCYDVSLPREGSVYEGRCPIIHALHIIGGKWKLPIIWHMADKKVIRYNALRRDVKGITNMMLTKCLRELEEDGLVMRMQYPGVPPKVEYKLTERGRMLIPALNNLYAWGETMLQNRRHD